MKPLLVFLLSFVLVTSSCTSYHHVEETVIECGTYRGHKLYKGLRGGCYYINRNGNKTYVDRSYCNC